MKKTFHLSVLVVLAVICGIAFSSCKKSSSGPSLTGVWQETHEIDTQVDSTTTPITVTTHDTTFAAPYPLTITFTSNGNFTFANGGSSEPGTYFTSGNNLVLQPTGSPEAEVTSYTISGNTLTLTFIEISNPGDESESEVLTLTKQ
ncbi:MAG TPA: lipocalin family protein [Ferruginibacter sp.]|nr:lipocalin family protein [Ferruginibacter sp.]